MNRRQNCKKAQGFTFIELLVLIGVVVILGVWALMMMHPVRSAAPRISCVNNLKQIGTAYRVWAGDNNDRYPVAVPSADGGWRDIVTNANSGIDGWTNYVIMENELGQCPQVIVCPSDKRQAATNFIVKGTPQDKGNADFKGNCNVSYFVGVVASDIYPTAILGGDRHLGPGLKPAMDYGYSPANGSGNDVVIRTNSPVCWSLRIHSGGKAGGAGNILLGDGSVQQCSSSRFRTDYQAFAGVPRLSDQTNSPGQVPPSSPWLRLIFP